METDNAPSLGDYLTALRRRRFVALVTAVPVVMIGLVLAIALPDVYRSTATFRLVTDRVTDPVPGRSEYIDQAIYALVDKLATDGTLAAIARQLEPYPDLADERHGGEAASKIRENFEVRMITRTVLEPGGGRERIIQTGFRLVFSHPSPEKAQQVAKELTSAFIEAGRAEQLEAASSRVRYFAGEAERLSLQIAKLEKRMADFKSTNFDRLPEAAQANVVTRGRLEQELDGVEREIRTLKQNRVFVLQQLQQAQAGPMTGSLVALEEEYARKSAVYSETHPDMIALKRQIDSLKSAGSVATGNSLQAQLEQQQAALAEAFERYSENHPDVKRLTRNVELLQARIASGEAAPGAAADTLISVQLQTQLHGIDTQIAGLQARGDALRDKLSRLEKQLGSTPEVEREYQEITRGLGSSRDQYNQMIERRLEADAEVAAISTGAADRYRLFTAPRTPWAPAGPPRIGILLVSAIAAMIMSLSVAVGVEITDGSVRGARDIRGILGAAPLAVVPQIRNSVYSQHRLRRRAVLVSAIIVGAPLLYFIVRLATA